jgi:hypothetical protein
MLIRAFLRGKRDCIAPGKYGQLAGRGACAAQKPLGFWRKSAIFDLGQGLLRSGFYWIGWVIFIFKSLA